MCCEHLSEPFRQDSSDESHNIYFYVELTRIIPYYLKKNPSYLELWGRLFKASLA